MNTDQEELLRRQRPGDITPSPCHLLPLSFCSSSVFICVHLWLNSLLLLAPLPCRGNKIPPIQQSVSPSPHQEARMSAETSRSMGRWLPWLVVGALVLYIAGPSVSRARQDDKGKAP